MRKLFMTFLVISFSVLILYSQDKVITGTIISSEDNFGLIGATVVVKGTTIGTITDFDGNYSIKVPEEADTLLFSFVGMATKEIAIGSQTVINITLEPEALEVAEVVVTALGIKREKKALGYSVQDVKNEQISRSNNDNIVNSLAGKVAGVNINSSSGAAGASTFIEIRGAASITRDNRPLFIIDGIPIDGGGGGYTTQGVATSDRVGDLNPDDIENISILKGGAASALYGMRAANGVVIITTKKGSEAKDGQIRINIHSSVSIDKISQVPELQTKYIQGSYYNADDRFADKYNRIGSPDGANFYRQFSWGPTVDSLTYTWDPNYIPFDQSYRYSGYYDSTEVYLQKWDVNGRIVYKPEYKGTPGLDDRYFDYNKTFSGGEIETYNPYDFFKTGITTTNSVNLSAGDAKRNYYVSYSNTNIDGIIPNNTYVKNNIKLTASSEIFEKFSSTASVNYMQNEGNRIQQGNNLSGLMFGILRSPINFDNAMGYEFDDGTQRNFQGNKIGGFDNPYWIVNNISYRDNTNRMVGNIELKYEPADWIYLTYRMGNDWYHQEAIDFFEIGSNEYPNGNLSKTNVFSSDLDANFFVNMNKTFADDFNLTWMLGSNIYQTKYRYVAAEAMTMSIQGWQNLANTDEYSVFEGSMIKRSAALFTDFGLSYKSMFFTNITGREEWSSTLPKGVNKFFYPSVSLGFVFTEIGNLKDNNILPFGKIRTSYGITGITAREYSTYTRFNRASSGDGWTNGVYFPFQGTTGFSYYPEIGNSELKPEKQKTFELGADLRFINNLFRIDAGYYKNINEDLLIPAPIPASTGFPTKYMNIGSMETNGIELTFEIALIKTKAINWNLQINFDKPNTMVTYLSDNNTNINVLTSGGFDDPQIHAVLDQPYRSIYGTRWLRDDDGNLILYDNDLDDQYGYPQQDINSGIIGQFQYDYKMGISNTITIKDLTLYALLDIKKGGQMWNGTKGALYYFGRHIDTETRETEVKTFEGRLGHLNDEGEIVHYDENGNEVAGPGVFAQSDIKMDEYWYTVGPGSVFTGPVEDFVEDADWFRLKEVSVSYNFSKLLKNTPFKNLEIYFTGKNLILITPYDGVDPETSLFGNGNAQGIDYFNMPGTKTYSFGIKLGF
ncbi:MAG: SusC/RagA family TonB-linked outer membrane protein [Bacteroidales bacterium]|nr:SusC/RagA family TonB-linked outer membrane protein [Bacteroidales bacterium]